MHQNLYQDKIGSASLNISQATAGSKIDCLLTYKAGFLGIDDSGSLKILFRAISDYSEFQFDDPDDDNYVKITARNKDIDIKINAKATGTEGKAYIRPWSRGFTLWISNKFLEEGDELSIDFKRWRVQTFCERTFEFKVLVDPLATGKYLEVPNSPEIEISPDKPAKIVVVAPTKVLINKPFKLVVKLEDQWGNPCANLDGIFSFAPNNLCKNLLQQTVFKNGRAELTIEMTEDGMTHIQASYNDELSAVSNPIIAVKEAPYYHYWADLHGQSEETMGTNNIDEYFDFARNYALLDVACLQANDFQISSEFWRKTNEVAKQLTKDGEFIVFPGYEWSGNTLNGGDRNILYLEDGMPIYRSSRLLIDEFEDTSADANTVHELFRKLKGKNAITIAHIGGRYADLAMHDESIERAIEVHSDWGTFEWLLFEALERNYRVGIVANSDGHTGRPGASYPTQTYFYAYGGLTCILARELTRESIFKALYNRHCYATTGARIFLNVQVFIRGSLMGMMGDVLEIIDSPTLRISYKGTAALDRIEIFHKSKILSTNFPTLTNEAEKTIKIIWSGSKIKGRDRNISWKGSLQVKQNAIKALQRINFFNEKDYINQNGTSLSIEGTTTGGLQGCILQFEQQTGELALRMNEKEITLPIKEITQIPRVYEMGGLDAKLQIYQTANSNGSQTVEFEYKLEELNKGDNPIFVKVLQKDGHMVWSSPIYFNHHSV